jgi:hypothetical protein
MRQPKDGDIYFFVDENGDSTFYNRKGKLIVGEPGCSTHLTLGFIRVKHDPNEIRQAMVKLHQEVINDPYFQQLPSFADTSVAFHANKDAPEVRYLVFRLIRSLNFKACFVMSHKNEQVFQELHHGKTNEYYDDLIARLFQNSLHRYQRNHICIATRGSRTRQKPLEMAVERARLRFQTIYNVERPDTTVSIEPQSLKGEPCLSVIDYVGWALQRAHVHNDMRYYRLIEDKIGIIVEMETGKKPAIYCEKNPFKVKDRPGVARFIGR